MATNNQTKMKVMYKISITRIKIENEAFMSAQAALFIAPPTPAKAPSNHTDR